MLAPIKRWSAPWARFDRDRAHGALLQRCGVNVSHKFCFFNKLCISLVVEQALATGHGTTAKQGYEFGVLIDHLDGV